MNHSKRLSIPMTRRERVGGWLYVPVYFVALSLVLNAIFLFLGQDVKDPVVAARLNGIFFLVNFLATVLIYHRFLLRSLVQVGRRFWGFVQAVILGLAMYQILTWVLLFGLGYCFPWLQNVNDGNIAIMTQASRQIMIVGTVVLVPVAEECIFRGLLFQGLFARSRGGAYLVSTLAFCLVHVANYVGHYDALTLFLCALEYIPAGVALAWSYEKSDTIFAPILIHSLVNLISVYSLTAGLF